MDTRLRVLAVARNRTTLQLCLLGLWQEGMDVFHAADGEDAIEAAVREQPDVIVLDTTVPGAGLPVLRELKTHAATARIPVVALTASAGPDERIRNLIVGADAQIAKPFSLDEISQTVRNLGHMSRADLAARRGDVLGRLRELA
jgi:DNA-binding response OmpR family regulator